MKWLHPVSKSFSRAGWEAVFADSASQGPCECDFAIVWNGLTSTARMQRSMLEESGIPHCIVEVGFFSQMNHVLFSMRGSAGRYLFMEEDIPQASKSEITELKDFAKHYTRGVEFPYRGHVAGMLQKDNDTAIREEPRFNSMKKFVAEVEKLHTSDEVVFKVHPGCKRPGVKTSRSLYRGASMWPHVLPAKLVTAVNSTSLYEAALAGKEVLAIGECPLSREPSRHIDIVNEIYRRQVPLSGDGFAERIRRSVGLVL